VLRFGGEEALTKPEITGENTLKFQLSVEDSRRIGLGIDRLVEKNVVALCTHQVLVEQEPKPKVTRVRKKSYPRRSRLSRVVQRLYNLESGNEPEKPLNIDLGLYQMETY